MLALVKTAAGPGLSLETVPDPEIGINDVLIRVHRTGICGTDLHIEALGRVGREDDPRRRSSWATSSSARSSRSARNVYDFAPGRHRERRGPRHLRPVPPLPGRPPAPVRPHDRPGRRPRRRVRRVRRAADDQRLAPLAGHRRGRRRDLRPVRQRRAHRARVPRPRRGRADHGRRADRPDGDRRSRATPGRGSSWSASPTPSVARWPRAWAPRRRRPARARPGRRPARSWAWSRASTSRSRCRATRPRCGRALDNMAHGGSIAILGIPTEEISLDVNEIVFKLLTIRGIYGREMYETWYKMTVMLQSGLDITPGDHRTASGSATTRRRSRRPAPATRARSSSTGSPGDATRGGHADDRDPPEPPRLPRRRAGRAARAPPVPAAAGHVVGPGPDRLDRRPAA